jgi:hypothetical protein
MECCLGDCDVTRHNIFRTYSMLWKILPFALHTSSVSTSLTQQIMPILRILCYNGSWFLLNSIGTDCTENTTRTTLPLLRACLLRPIPSSGRSLQSHYLATVVVWLLILRSLPTNGSTCHIINSK